MEHAVVDMAGRPVSSQTGRGRGQSGTLMRYGGRCSPAYCLSRPIPTLPLAIGLPPPRRGPIAASGCACLLSACILRAAALAVDLTAIAGAADENLAAAPGTEEKARGCEDRVQGHGTHLPNFDVQIQPRGPGASLGLLVAPPRRAKAHEAAYRKLLQRARRPPSRPRRRDNSLRPTASASLPRQNARAAPSLAPSPGRAERQKARITRFSVAIHSASTAVGIHVGGRVADDGQQADADGRPLRGRR